MPLLATALIGDSDGGTPISFWPALVANVGVGAAALIDDDPRQRGLGPDGSAPETALSSRSVQGWSVKEAVRTRRFSDLMRPASKGRWARRPVVDLVPYAIDHKLEQTMAVLFFGTIGVEDHRSIFPRQFRRPHGAGHFPGRHDFGMAASLAIWAVAARLPVLIVLALALFCEGWVAILARSWRVTSGRAVSAASSVSSTPVSRSERSSGERSGLHVRR